MMANFKEEEPCITVTLSFFCNLWQDFFLNLCKKVTKTPKFKKKSFLKFDFSFIKKTKSKIEKTQCYEVKQLFFFEMSPNTTM